MLDFARRRALAVAAVLPFSSAALSAQSSPDAMSLTRGEVDIVVLREGHAIRLRGSLGRRGG